MKKSTVKISKAEREAASMFGRIGGLASARKAGHKGMSERGKKGSVARWGKKK